MREQERNVDHFRHVSNHFGNCLEQPFMPQPHTTLARRGRHSARLPVTRTEVSPHTGARPTMHTQQLASTQAPMSLGYAYSARPAVVRFLGAINHACLPTQLRQDFLVLSDAPAAHPIVPVFLTTPAWPLSCSRFSHHSRSRIRSNMLGC